MFKYSVFVCALMSPDRALDLYCAHDFIRIVKSPAVRSGDLPSGCSLSLCDSLSVSAYS